MGEGPQPDYQLVWEPQEGPQTALLTCPCFEVFFGGARGGGKTDGMLGEFANHADLYGDNAIGLMVRRTRTELVETIERSKQLFSPLGAKFHEQDKMWRFPNGARLRFAYLERDSDADAYQGHSYSRVYVEEAGTFPSERPILKLMATLRSGAGVPVGIRLTGNPGGPGQQWVKARYIDPQPTGWKVQQREFKNPFTGEQVSRDWVFIPSRVTDNAYLGGEYIAGLQMVGSAQLVKAWLEGDWNVVEGAFFDNWRQDKHVVAPFNIPDTWLRFRSMDWGSASPFSIGWWAVVQDDYLVSGRVGGSDSDTGRILPRGCLVRYREWYGAESPGKGLKLSNSELADGIISREQKDPKLSYGVIDPACFAEQGGPSIAEQINTLLTDKKLVPFHEADNKRIAQRGAMSGWDQMRGRLHGDDQGRPMIVTFDTCRDSIRTIPVLQHDPDKPEDLDTEAEDHCFVSGTYVDTDRGSVCIDDLDPKQHRIWSAGEWRSDYTMRRTRRDAETVCVKFEDGRLVYCTPDHMFLDCSGEWRYAKDLLGVEVACDQQSLARQSKNLMASVITFVGCISRSAEFACIELFGNGITDRSQMRRISIIKMGTERTTLSKTLSALRFKSTWAASMAKRALSAVGTAFTKLAKQLADGMVLRSANVGTQSTSTLTLGQSWSGGFQHSAKSAARRTWSARPRSSKASIATLIAKPARCVGVEDWGRHNVYCLNVPGSHLFTIEGGLVVHNCADEWRYACMSRPWVRKAKPEAEKALDDYVKHRPDTGQDNWVTY
jgi:terminase large subunit-like protein